MKRTDHQENPEMKKKVNVKYKTCKIHNNQKKKLHLSCLLLALSSKVRVRNTFSEAAKDFQ